MSESIQKTLLRVRPPRVRITYDVETGGAIEKKEIPFIVGLFADLSGEVDPDKPLPPFKDRGMTDIDRDNINDVLKSSCPRVKLSGIANVLPDAAGQVADGAMLSGALGFESLDDFNPASIVTRIPQTNALYAARAVIRGLQARGETDDALAGALDDAVKPDGQAARDALLAAFDPAKEAADWQAAAIMPDVADTAPAPARLLALLLNGDPDDVAKARALGTLGEFTKQIVQPLQASQFPAAKVAKGAATVLIDERVAQIDQALSAQLSLVMHAPAFKALEATWRGMYYLVSRSETGVMLKLRVLNATRRDLLKDMEKAVEFDQSALFKMIYEAEYGTYGGFPYSLLVGAYEFGPDSEAIECLKKLSQVAAAAHAPFIAAADSGMFGLDSYVKLGKPRDLAKIFEGVDLTGWREFRGDEDSRYVSLVLPHVLMRLPYGRGGTTCEVLDFQEDVGAPDQSAFLWGNAAFTLAERITHAFSLYSWTAAIRGVEGGGLVEGLPLYAYDTSAGTRELFCPTEVTITDRREKELNDLGFIALCHCKGAGKAAFFGGQTANRPKKYITDEANANARISAMLPYILAASRFAHYIKVIMREKVGSFMTRGNVENYLNTWIAQYVLLDDNAGQEVKAGYPLRMAMVEVTDVPGEPGAYNAVVFLKPHFQLEELTTSIRLVAKIPA
jgi:type VI secretion system protein ImpC